MGQQWDNYAMEPPMAQWHSGDRLALCAHFCTSARLARALSASAPAASPARHGEHSLLGATTTACTIRLQFYAGAEGRNNLRKYPALPCAIMQGSSDDTEVSGTIQGRTGERLSITGIGWALGAGVLRVARGRFSLPRAPRLGGLSAQFWARVREARLFNLIVVCFVY